MTEKERQIQINPRRFPYYEGPIDPHIPITDDDGIKGRRSIDLFHTFQADELEN